MLSLMVDQASVDQTIEYLETVRKRIFEQVRLGMQEAMDREAVVAIAEMGAAGIQPRTGELEANIAKSPRVRETRDAIIGTVTAERTMKLKGRTFLGYVGTALDEGFHVRGVEGTLLRITEPNEGTFFSRGHVAFDVAPHPFLRSASESFAPSLLDIIQARIAAGVEAA